MLRKIDNRISELRNIRKEIQQLLDRNQTAVKQEKQVVTEQVQHNSGLEAKTLKELRVAAIMDEFTLACFQPECQLTELTPQNWKAEMEAAQPELLFIESAWQGKDKLWHGKINHCSSELYDLTDYCHEKNIPVIFWNKEDPGYTDTFMPTARRADVVFTTDLECIEKYKTELGHDRVYHLHFAAQPVVHNPIEKYERKDKFCFAGAYYHRYQERCRVFDAFSDYFIQTCGFDIYDRNYQNARPEHKFPERYDPYILGRLEPSEIDIAYKGYVYGINMNSSPQSQTMFARRVFELMASNTLVVGNYCRGVKNYFGDLTFCTDDEKTLRKAFEQYCKDRDSADKLRLLALRKVLKEHLCEDRLDYIVQKAWGCSLKKELPEIVVYARVKNQKQADRAAAMFRKQNYENKKLILAGDVTGISGADISICKQAEFDSMAIAEGDFWACFSPEDWYGENYLLDLALATRYGCFDVIGKGEYFASQEDQTAGRTAEGNAYHTNVPMTARRCMVSGKLLSGQKGAVLTEEREWKSESAMSVDVMNYCKNWSEDLCPAAQDMILADQGIALREIETTAERINACIPVLDATVIEAKQIAQMKIGKNDPLNVELEGNKVIVTSSLPAETHRYIYLNERLDAEPLLEDGKIIVHFRGEGTLHTMGCVFFHDKDDKKISAATVRIGRKETITPPEGTVYIRIAYRFREAGIQTLYKIEFGNVQQGNVRGNCFLSRSNVLILTNHYPAPDDLYRNMFVHTRLTAYKDQGCVVDVMRMHVYAKNTLREFEGINVVEGHGEMLACALSNGQIDTVCVHFLDEDMWNILKDYVNQVRIIIWLHGAEIQPWWRREYNYSSREELEKAKLQSDIRMKFWAGVFETAKNADIQFVFVSQYFADEIFEDNKITLNKSQYKIIHNCIDTERFTYEKKNLEQRKKLLSIRPYGSNKYANDLTVKAIQELSREPWFKELDIALYGSGSMFDDLLKPLQKYKNVHIEKRFFTQGEIAQLHKEYGVFLTPTRMDAQGVSRDEAMASGLVPVTNAVTAIPEFVDESCGILAPGEDYKAMADGIRQLYRNPDMFLKMSENAAKRVRNQTSKEYTIMKELQLIFHNK